MYTLRHSLLALLFAGVFPAGAAPQGRTATLTLSVSDHATQAPLAGASVRLPALGLGALTDAAGRVRIAGVPSGTHAVQISRVGHRSELLFLGFAPGATVEGEVALLVAPVALETVQVTAEGGTVRLSATGFYERRSSGAGTFLDREAIEERAHRSSQLSSALRGLPGLRLQRSPGRSGYAIASSRGTVGIYESECHAQIILDGMRLPAPPDPPGYVDVDALVSAQQVEGIEWYSGPAQTPQQFNATGPGSLSAGRRAQYGPHCGTLVLWTRAGG